MRPLKLTLLLIMSLFLTACAAAVRSQSATATALQAQTQVAYVVQTQMAAYTPSPTATRSTSTRTSTSSPTITPTPTITRTSTPTPLPYVLRGTPISWYPLERIATHTENISPDNIDRLQELARWQVDGVGLPSVVFSPDGSQLAFSNQDGDIFLLETAEGSEVTSFVRLNDYFAARLVFSPDGGMLAGIMFKHGYTPAQDVTVLRWWNVEDGEVIHSVWQPLGTTLTDLAFAPDDYSILASDNHGFLYGWRILDTQLTLEAEMGGSHIAVLPDGKTLLTMNSEGVTLWDYYSREMVSQFQPGGIHQLVSMALSSDGSLLATGTTLAGGRALIYIWRVSDGELLHTLEAHTGQVTSLAFSADNRLLVSGGFVLDDNTLRFWNVATGNLIQSWPGSSEVFFSPDGKLMGRVQGGQISWWGVRP